MEIQEINRAVEWLAANRPHYATILAFYGRLFVLQETSRQTTAPEPIAVSRAVLEDRASNEEPLVQVCEFGLDARAGRSLFLDLCLAAGETAPNMAVTALGARRAVGNDPALYEALATAITCENETRVEEAAGRLNADKAILAFLLYQSMKPSIALSALTVPDLLGRKISWDHGPCPVCGSDPVLAVLDENGKRVLHCGFCWRPWDAPRVFCPFCGNKNQETLVVYKVEQEPEYRLDSCKACGRYIKTIDTRETSRPVHPPLEDCCTAHLEMLYKQSVAQ